MSRFRSLSLAPFLDSCDEDRAYKTFFGRRPDLVPKGSRIVDLGCGPASKIAAISWGVRDQASDFLLIDRDERWRDAIESNLQYDFAPRSNVQVIVGDIFKDVGAETLSERDVALILQVGYGEEFAREFGDWIRTVAARPRTWIISAESHASPTAVIRRLIGSTLGLSLTGSALPAIRKSLAAAGLSVERAKIADKVLDVRGERIDEGHWLLDFLLGEDGAFADLTSSTQGELVMLVRQEIEARRARMRLFDDVLIAKADDHGRH